MTPEEAEAYLKWMTQRESTEGIRFQELIESDKDLIKRLQTRLTVQNHDTKTISMDVWVDLMKAVVRDDKEIKRLREGIEQAVKLLNTDANATRELLKELIE